MFDSYSHLKLIRRVFFLSQDVILVAIGAAGYLAGAGALANYAEMWRGARSPGFENTVARVTNATAAAAVSHCMEGMV